MVLKRYFNNRLSCAVCCPNQELHIVNILPHSGSIFLVIWPGYDFTLQNYQIPNHKYMINIIICQPLTTFNLTWISSVLLKC